VKDAKGKTLGHEHYKLLKELGIEVVLYDLKTYNGMHQPTGGELSYGFELYGSLTDDIDFDALLELLKLLTIAKASSNPAIKDAFEHLRIVIGVADE